MQPDHVPLRKHYLKKTLNSLHKEQANSQAQHSVHFIGQSNIECIHPEQPASPSQNFYRADSVKSSIWFGLANIGSSFKVSQEWSFTIEGIKSSQGGLQGTQW